MSEMPMPGDWTMSMVWMRTPGQSWPGAMLSFLGMWMPMMVAMMLPSVLPVLWRYHRTVATGGVRRGRLTLLAGAAYLLVWSAIGAAAFPVGALLASAAMRLPELARSTPFATGVVALLAGLLQFTAWKAHHLRRCRELPRLVRTPGVEAGGASRFGLRLGVHCVCSGVGPMAVLLTAGLMDLRVMAAVTAAITIERLAPAGERVARVTGVLFAAIGLLMVARQLGLG